MNASEISDKVKMFIRDRLEDTIYKLLAYEAVELNLKTKAIGKILEPNKYLNLQMKHTQRCMEMRIN